VDGHNQSLCVEEIILFDQGIHFDQPSALWLIVLVGPIIWMGWRRLTGMSQLKRSIICVVRSVLIALIAVTLAMPKWMDKSEAMTVVILLDRSRSISPQLEADALRRMQIAAGIDREQIDRLGIINIGGESRVRTMPDPLSVFQDSGVVVVSRDATNLEQGIQLGLAIAPRDTAVRFVLVSDGNETAGDVLAAAEIASANGIPIDVFRLTYDYDREVLFDRISAPAQARQGQSVPIKLILRSQQQATGTVTMTINGEPIDLDPTTSGNGRRVTLEPGVNPLQIPLLMSRQGVHRIKASFEPDVVEGEPEQDARASNNQADAVIVVGGEGRVLVIYEDPRDIEALGRALNDAQIETDAKTPSEIPGDLLGFSEYDSIILANVPGHAFSPAVHEALRQYVHDVGGGLIMIGGPNSFGAGGWINTAVSRALPVKLEPQERHQMPRGALVCIMHSCEMPSGNYVGEQCCIAAINALSRLDLVGIIDFDWGQQSGPGGNQGCNWVYPLSEVGSKSAAIAAAKKMTMGDMPDFTPAMKMALAQLKTVAAGQKHVIIISDGDPSRPSPSLVNAFAAERITISTVLVGGHASPSTMKWIAKATGGEFYSPKASQIPQIFIKEAMVVRRSLIVEGDVYSTVSRPTARPGPFAGSMSGLPTIDGYVLTSARPGYSPEIIIGTAEGETSDPLFAQWQYGLGHSAVFTSDASTRWCSRWTSWGEYEKFWEQVVRWSMRPAAPTDLLVDTHLDGEKGVLEVQTLTSEGGFAPLGEMQCIVISPSGETKTVTVYQTGPGRGRGEWTTDESGTWVVNLTRQAEGEGGGRSAVQAGLCVPFSPEYRALSDNSALLTLLAQKTGGRDLPSDPKKADLYNRTNLEQPSTFTDLWPLLMILVCALLVFDVAARRLAIDYLAMRRRFHDLLHPRESSAGAGMSELKQTRGQVRRQLDGDERESGRAKGDVHFEAGEGDRDSLIDMDEMTGDDQGRKRKPTRQARPVDQTAGDESEDEGTYTSRLLDAKRRAQQDRADHDDPKGGGSGGSGGSGHG